MAHLKELQKTILSVADTLSHQPPAETLVYIHIGGNSVDELEDALDCIYFDDRRNFKLVEIKRSFQLISALIVMERITPVKF